MSDQSAFLAAICSAPDDDAPRLEFADWLENDAPVREPEWAEFIRVQCRIAELESSDKRRPTDAMELLGYRQAMCRELKTLSAVLDNSSIHDRDCERCLKKRDRELWHGDWVKKAFMKLPLSVLQLGNVQSVLQLGNVQSPISMFGVLRRGFVHSLTCIAVDWFAHADSLYYRPNQPCPETAQPIREITLTDVPEVECRASEVSTESTKSQSLFGIVGRYHQKWIESNIHATIAFRAPGLAKLLLEGEFPGITFNLPPSLDEARRSIRRGVARLAMGASGLQIDTR